MVATVTVAILWRDGSVTKGANATEVLEQECGGWNPQTVAELRVALAQRAGMYISPTEFDDEQFLQHLDACGVLTYQHINA